jgi:hypothetical protein
MSKDPDDEQSVPRGQCPVCRYRYRLRAAGTVQRHHGYSGSDPLPDCRGSTMMPLDEPDEKITPRRILVAGDLHANTLAGVHLVKTAAKLLRDEEQPLILQLGDFGIWPGLTGTNYIRWLEQACSENNVEIWFVDGNHEDFTQVHHFDPWQSRYRWITHLPRGWRWRWHGRSWLALGGAVSLDRAVRVWQRDWWPEEEITEEQAAEAVAGGRAHIMVTHECPSRVTHTFPPPPSFWDLRDIARSDAHRERLQGVVSAVRPGWLMHGHLHRAYQRVTDLGYGPVEVTGLDMAGGDGPNWAILDVKLMRWENDA